MKQVLSERWQTLIGSALGPFLSIILSAIGFYIEQKWKQQKEKKEAIRRAEISFSQTLTHINIAVTQLEEFINRVNAIIEELESSQDLDKYVIQGANFPATINIHFDQELIKMKFNSYYIHNKIIIAEYLIKTSNDSIKKFRYEFESLLEKIERMATPERMTFKKHRETSISLFGGFIQMVKKTTNALKDDYTKSIVKAKVYNLKLMKSHLGTLWRYEGKYKFFKNREKMKEYNGSMQAIDRIDRLMEEEAPKLVTEMSQRRKKI